MTVATESNLVTYAADGMAVTFPFTFPVYDEDHLQVYLRDDVTFVQLAVNTSDYSVTGIGDENGGNVVFGVAPLVGSHVLIAREVPLTQDLDVLNQGGFYPNNVETEFDLQEMQIQQLAEQLGRTVYATLGEVFPPLLPPPGRAGKLLGFTDDANAYPTTDTEDLLFAILSGILQAGPGITITLGGGTITIGATASDDLQNCWLLEDATPGGGGSGTLDAEAVRDIIGTALQGLGCAIVVDDAANTITVDCTGSATAEVIRDVIGVALIGSTYITVTPNDGADTITVALDTSAAAEFIRDTAGAALVGGVGIAVTLDDAGNTITIDSKPDIQTVVSAAIVTPTFADDQVNITAQHVGLTLADWTGTAVNGHGILIQIKDDGTSRAILYGGKYRAFNDALPAATVLGKTMYLGCVYNEADDKIDVLGVRVQA